MTGEAGDPVSLMHRQKQHKAITHTATITIAKIHAPAMSRKPQALGVLVTEMSFGAFVSGRTVRLLDFVSWTKIIGIKTEINKHYRIGG